MSPQLDEIKEQIINQSQELLEDEPKPEPPPSVIYDRNLPQTVPMVINRGEKVFNVSIEISPITDEDYFKLMEEVPEHTKRVKSVSVELFAPFANLGRRLAIKRNGFTERTDWREKTDNLYYVNAVQGVLSVVPVVDGINTDELLDDEAEIRICLKSGYNGKECLTAVSFREESNDEMNEYFAAVRGEPQKGVLASAKKISKERRLFALYEALKIRVENYESDGVPAWHAVEAVEAFLLMQFSRVGKPAID